MHVQGARAGRGYGNGAKGMQERCLAKVRGCEAWIAVEEEGGKWAGWRDCGS